MRESGRASRFTLAVLAAASFGLVAEPTETAAQQKIVVVVPDQQVVACSEDEFRELPLGGVTRVIGEAPACELDCFQVGVMDFDPVRGISVGVPEPVLVDGHELRDERIGPEARDGCEDQHQYRDRHP